MLYKVQIIFRTDRHGPVTADKVSVADSLTSLSFCLVRAAYCRAVLSFRLVKRADSGTVFRCRLIGIAERGCLIGIGDISISYRGRRSPATHVFIPQCGGVAPRTMVFRTDCHGGIPGRLVFPFSFNDIVFIIVNPDRRAVFSRRIVSETQSGRLFACSDVEISERR